MEFLAKIKALFRKFDSGNLGFITGDYVKPFLRELNLPPTVKFNDVFKRTKVETHSRVTFGDIVDVLTSFKVAKDGQKLTLLCWLNEN